MAGRYNLDLERGVTLSKDIKWTNIYGGLMDLTKFTAKMQIRDEFQDGTLLLELTSGSGITITNDIISILITATQTLALAAGRNYYSLVLTRSDGFIVRILEGYVNII